MILFLNIFIIIIYTIICVYVSFECHIDSIYITYSIPK